MKGGAFLITDLARFLLKLDYAGLSRAGKTQKAKIKSQSRRGLKED